jgi:hypothetical protein
VRGAAANMPVRSRSTATHCARRHKGEAGGQRPLPGWGGVRTGGHDEKTRRPAAREGHGLKGGVRTGVRMGKRDYIYVYEVA